MGGLGVLIGVGAIIIGVVAVLQVRDVREDARRYLDEIGRFRRQAEDDVGIARDSAQQAKDSADVCLTQLEQARSARNEGDQAAKQLSKSAEEAVSARDKLEQHLSVAEGIIGRLVTVTATGALSAFSLWIALAEQHRSRDEVDNALSATDYAARLVEETPVRHARLYLTLGATYDSLGSSQKALDWADKALEITEGKSPQAHFVRGTVLLNYQRPPAEADRRLSDFNEAEREFTTALDLNSAASQEDKLDDLVLGKVYYFRGLARYHRVESGFETDVAAGLSRSIKDLEAARQPLLRLKETARRRSTCPSPSSASAALAMEKEADRWLAGIDRGIAAARERLAGIERERREQ